MRLRSTFYAAVSAIGACALLACGRSELFADGQAIPNGDGGEAIADTDGGADGGTGEVLTADSGPTCAERTAEAENMLGAAALAVKNDVSCERSSDCAIATVETLCTLGCGGKAVNQAGAAQVQAVANQINSGICATFQADGCNLGPSPPCLAIFALCVDGGCVERP